MRFILKNIEPHCNKTVIKDIIRAAVANLSKKRSYFINKRFEKIQKISDINANSIAIIAPHPDDETFACGGLIAKKASEGAEVHVIFMTCGEASHDGCCDSTHQEVADSRVASAKKAANILGLANTNLHWINLPDTQVPSDQSTRFLETASKLESTLSQINPEAIIYPNKIDYHIDHINSCHIACWAADKVNIKKRYSYPTWMRIRFQAKHAISRINSNIIKIDIKNNLDTKKKAIQAYLNTNPKNCRNGISSAGRLEDSFINLFKSDYEILFDESF